MKSDPIDACLHTYHQITFYSNHLEILLGLGDLKIELKKWEQVPQIMAVGDAYVIYSNVNPYEFALGSRTFRSVFT